MFAKSQRLEPDAQQATIQSREPEAGARRAAGHDSEPRASWTMRAAVRSAYQKQSLTHEGQE